MTRLLSYRMLVMIVTLMLPALAGMAQDGPPLLHPLFQDHAVLQREAPLQVWGTAAPGETVTVAMAGATATAEADAAGRWSVRLPARAAGGPYTLEARSSGGRTQSATDVLVGDVFLCSGQSNMELPVSRTLNAPSEIGGSANDRIRMLHVSQATSAAPLDTFPRPVAWERAAPETVPDWSAVCYYFARDLQRHVDVPVGLINSSWGGSNIRAWMNEAALTRVGGYAAALALLRQYAEDEPAAQQTFGARWEAWWRERTGDAAGAEPWQPATGAAWTPAPEGLGNWQTWDAPAMQRFTGMVWFRTTVTLTPEQARQAAVLSLGGIDEVDQTWINGHVVGNTFGWGTERTYPIPADLLRAGENVVVVNVLNTWGAGGVVGDPARRALVLADGARVPLEAWRYQPVPAAVGMPPRAPWESVGGLSTIHNAMVAPLQDYGLKGALWYQGESNTGEAGTYRALLEALMGAWREQFGAALPVLVVQLANYGRPPTAPTESGWAEVREAQRRATQADPHAGLAVAIDLGDVYDIHPANKQEVGRRLARAARHVIYGEAVTPSGPVPARAARQGDTVVVTFDDVDGALVAYSHTAPIGFELCGPAPGSCRYADARIDGSRVLLPVEAGHEVTRVRYCWADSPICTLYDTSGLPAGPFALDVAEE